jgi:sarcosine oxidase subunit gamma
MAMSWSRFARLPSTIRKGSVCVSDLIASMALDGIADPRSHADAGVWVQDLSGLPLVSMIARRGCIEALASELRSAYGIDLPMTPRVAETNSLTVIWSGIDRWLVWAVDNQDLEGELRARLGRSASFSDQSDGRTILRIGGVNARRVLAKGIPVDLHPRVFKPGDTAVTLCGHIGVQFWQVDDRPTYDLAVFRSLSESLWHWLLASSAEFGLSVLDTVTGHAQNHDSKNYLPQGNKAP